MYNLIGIRCFDLARKYKYLGCRKIPNELNFIIEMFNMKDAVARCQPLGDEFKLSKKQTPKSKASKRRMAKIKDYLYQKKLHEPLGEAKPLGMKVEDRIRCGKKPSASNKMFLIRQLVNTKMKDGASVVDNGNEFKSILSRLVLVVIKFDDEVHAMLLLSSLPES
ncbi:hypothetical protein Tco_0569690 [Tanacetum coccineum]